MGDLFKKPKVSDPTPMPVVDDASSKAAAERARLAAINRGGRASTVMTRRRPTAEGGTTSYTNSLLGSAG